MSFFVLTDAKLRQTIMMAKYFDVACTNYTSNCSKQRGRVCISTFCTPEQMSIYKKKLFRIFSPHNLIFHTPFSFNEYNDKKTANNADFHHAKDVIHMKETAVKTKKGKNMKRVFNLLVVDESGSMSIIQHQALVGINETLETIQKMQQAHKELEQTVTLITFDSTHKKLVYDNMPADKATPLRSSDYNPCGGTPLYDAIGMGIAKINAQATEDDTVLVTIITDGEENCSEEYDLRMIKNLIEKLKKQRWTFTFIGTDNLDVENIACCMGIDNHLQFKEDEEGTRKMFARERLARTRFSQSIAEDRCIEPGSYFDE